MTTKDGVLRYKGGLKPSERGAYYCSVHPEYMGVLKPRVPCKVCHDLFTAAAALKSIGHRVGRKKVKKNP